MKDKGTFLVVDDEQLILELFKKALGDRGHSVYLFGDPLEAEEFIVHNPVDVAIIDYYMPQLDGIELLKRVKKLNPELEVIMMTGRATVEMAVEAMKNGAFDYFQKPFEQIETVILTAERALEKKKLLDYNKALQERLDTFEHFDGVVGNSPKMLSVFNLVEMVAKYDVSVLILGETGTGKEKIAKTIHHKSQRRHKPFIPVDCSSLPENLIESILFGYKKGAFTGANSDKVGLIEAADGGTLFLDEIGELPLNLQVKLLRVLQEGEIQRLGELFHRKVDIRVISATNRDLKEEIKRGNFREDLYFRLNIIEIVLPPLRERKEDIPALAYFFLKKYSERYRKNIKKISPSALTHLQSYHWPGNVRELEHVIARAIILEQKDEITLSSLPEFSMENPTAQNQSSGERGMSLLASEYFYLPFREAKTKLIEQFEYNYLQMLIERANYNLSEASRLSQVDRSNLRRMLKKYELWPPKTGIKRKVGAQK